MKTANLRLEPLACPSCLQKIEGAIRSVDGVMTDSIQIRFNSGRVTVKFDEKISSVEAIKNAIESVGYPVMTARSE